MSGESPVRPRRRRSPHSASSGPRRQLTDSDEELRAAPPFLSSADDTEWTTPLMGAADVDEPDGPQTAAQGAVRLREATEHLQTKVNKCKEAIKQEQRIKEDNVNEYLRMTAAFPDKQQQQKLKAMFEKKNQKSAQQMGHLQRKLEAYTRRLRELETTGPPHRQPKEMLKDVGHGLRNVGGNIRHGITGLSGAVVGNVKGGIQGAAESVMSKPREIAHLLKNRFGSADNITALTNDSSEGTPTRSHHGSATLPPGIPSVNSSNATSIQQQGWSDQARSEEGGVGGGGSDLSSVASESGGGGGGLPVAAVIAAADGVAAELLERREECDRLREEVDTIKSTLQQELSLLFQQLQEERYRYDRLEEQLNDFIELHQNEVENLRQHIHDMEEKVQYQSEERVRDIHEMMDKCNTRIARMEHQQVEHQQLVNIEVIGNSQARALVVKLVNIVLTVLQVVLLIVATLAGIIMPFLRTRIRTLSTLVLILALIFVVRQWADVSDLFHHYVDYVRASTNHSAEPPP